MNPQRSHTGTSCSGAPLIPVLQTAAPHRDSRASTSHPTGISRSQTSGKHTWFQSALKFALPGAHQSRICLFHFCKVQRGDLCVYQDQGIFPLSCINLLLPRVKGGISDLSQYPLNSGMQEGDPGWQMSCGPLDRSFPHQHSQRADEHKPESKGNCIPGMEGRQQEGEHSLHTPFSIPVSPHTIHGCPVAPGRADEERGSLCRHQGKVVPSLCAGRDNIPSLIKPQCFRLGALAL